MSRTWHHNDYQESEVDEISAPPEVEAEQEEEPDVHYLLEEEAMGPYLGTHGHQDQLR